MLHGADFMMRTRLYFACPPVIRQQKNILAKKAFTVSFADVKNVVASDYVGIVSANNEPKKL